MENKQYDKIITHITSSYVTGLIGIAWFVVAIGMQLIRGKKRTALCKRQV